MKQCFLGLLVLLLSVQFAFGQTKDMNTARNYLQTYLEYEKSEKKTESLGKAKSFIDKAELSVKEMQAANDPKFKTSNAGKVYAYKAMIYSEMAMLKDSPLSEGAAAQAIDAIAKTYEYDPKNENNDKNLIYLNTLYGQTFNAAADAYNNKDYEASFTGFNQALSLRELTSKMMDDKSGVFDTTAMQYAAMSARRSNRGDKAAEIYESLLQKGARSEEAYIELMDLYNSIGDKAKSQSTMEAARKAYPNSNAFLINEINGLLTEGKQSEAISKMEAAVKLYPNNESLYFALGSAYESTKQADTMMLAETAYKRALELKPGYFDALYNLGAYYYNQAADKIKLANDLPLTKQKEYETMKSEAEVLFRQALPYFEKANTANPNDPNAIVALKEIYAALGDQTKSMEYKNRYEALQKPK